jgi:hypothetical protein
MVFPESFGASKPRPASMEIEEPWRIFPVSVAWLPRAEPIWLTPAGEIA